ncbi:MAG: hypothetical protein U0V49_10665 [Saprospiraceae bacterium]
MNKKALEEEFRVKYLKATEPVIHAPIIDSNTKYQLIKDIIDTPDSLPPGKPILPPFDTAAPSPGKPILPPFDTAAPSPGIPKGDVLETAAPSPG